jgi:HKD family nuclease
MFESRNQKIKKTIRRFEMTKKELANLHSQKCVMERVSAQLGRGEEKRVIVSFSLTEMEATTLKAMLREAYEVRHDDVVQSSRYRADQAFDIDAYMTNAQMRMNNE